MQDVVFPPETSEYVPIGHGVQLDEPTSEKYPGLQMLQVTLDVAPTDDEKVPAGQAKQVVKLFAPVLDE
jgi:hypothetical protein